MDYSHALGLILSRRQPAFQSQQKLFHATEGCFRRDSLEGQEGAIIVEEVCDSLVHAQESIPLHDPQNQHVLADEHVNESHPVYGKGRRAEPDHVIRPRREPQGNPN